MSRKELAKCRRFGKNFQPWTCCLLLARQHLQLKGFAPLHRDGQLYKLARNFYDNHDKVSCIFYWKKFSCEGWKELDIDTVTCQVTDDDGFDPDADDSDEESSVKEELFSESESPSPIY